MQRIVAGWSSFRQELPALFVVGSLFVLVVGVLIGLVFYFNLRSSTDNRTQASANSTALSYLPSGGDLTPSSTPAKTYNLTLALTTGTAAIDGLQLDLVIKGNLTNLIAKPVNGSGLTLVKNTSVAIPGGYQTKLLLLPVGIGQPVQLASEKGIVELQFQAEPNNSVSLEVKSATSLATLFRQPSSQTLTIPSPVTYQLTGLSDPTPGTAPKLQLNFAQQGLSSSGVIVVTQLGLKNTSTNAIQKFDLRAKSGASGVLSLETPLSLKPEDVGQNYQVFVKTPQTLMKKLGEITIATGSNQAPAGWTQTPLLVGDLENTSDQANVINIVDIAKMLSIYTQLTSAVTASTTAYDVNFDGRIDIADVALVLANFTALQVTGDAP